ncbi:MAG: hypothetical protein D6796_02990, partial [Caldilineae bacterium]
PSAAQLRELAALDAETLEKLRRQSPALRPASGVTTFLQQGLAQAYNQRGKGLFGLLLTLPAIGLSAYQAFRSVVRRQSVEDAFPEGTWQFYTQFGLREDPARHANETEGFHQAIPPDASLVDQATAWAFQCITTIFEYESLLENEWVERILLHLVHEAITEAVIDKLTNLRLGGRVDYQSAEFQAMRRQVQETEVEQIELETEQLKQNLGLENLEWAWVTRRPYRKPRNHPLETYPQYRRKLFLEFLSEAAEKLPASMGAVIWDRYHELSATALPAYQTQMSILYWLKPERHQDRKVPIPLWKARLAFVAGGRYYLLDVAHRDSRGRVLAFKPGKPDDPGEPLLLREQEDGELLDQQGRTITIDRKGNVTITDANGNQQVKILRPTPLSAVRAQVAAILHEASILPPAPPGPDVSLAVAPRAHFYSLLHRLPRVTQLEIEALNHVPIILHWDRRRRADTLRQIRDSRRGVGNHALTIFRTESSFVFDQSHIFFDAIWGMVISQVITDGATETYRLVRTLPTRMAYSGLLSPLRLQGSKAFDDAVRPFIAPFEVTAETETPSLSLINEARRHLARLNVPATVNDLLTLYRGIFDRLYTPGLAVQRGLAQLRLEGHSDIAAEIERAWQHRREEPVSLLLPMDASFINPKLRLYPATFKNFLPQLADLYEATLEALDRHRYTPSEEHRTAFLEQRNLLLANLLVMTGYFGMLKHITRQGESLSTAAIKYLAHLPAGVQGTLDAIPQHVGALNEILKGEEVFSNVGRVSPTSSLVRFMSAKDDGASKVMVWGIMSDRHGNLKITLRDFRPHVAKLLRLGYGALAQEIVDDYLEAYARGLNQFAEDLTRIITSAA